MRWLSQLRQQTETAAIPFIFLAGRSDRADIRHGMELGADDYLTKPFTQAELLGAVQGCLSKYDRAARRYAAQVQETQSIEKQLQTSQELAEMNSVLLQKLSQELRHPVSNITIANLYAETRPVGQRLRSIHRNFGRRMRPQYIAAQRSVRVAGISQPLEDQSASRQAEGSHSPLVGTYFLRQSHEPHRR